MKKKIREHYLVRKKPRIQTRANWPINVFCSTLFLILGLGVTYYLLEGGKYAKIYAQLVDLQNVNYEQNSENLKIKLEIDKNNISIEKLSEQNKVLKEENNKLKEDVIFYEKMLGKRKNK
ncbi:hypothetical protein N9K20_00275 [Methylophilaceae bacterium]|nr:hypothetical protein [Methylophilaceae bacterium]